MKTVLIVLLAAIFLYSPLGPSWGRDAVNIALVLGLFSFFGRHVPKRPYRHDLD